MTPGCTAVVCHDGPGRDDWRVRCACGWVSALMPEPDADEAALAHTRALPASQSQASKSARWRTIGRSLGLALLLPRLALGEPPGDAGLADGGAGESLGAIDGGTPDAGRFGDPLYAQCPANDPTQPATLQDDGSWRLPAARAARQVCLLVTCDERRKQLEAAPPPLGATSLLFAGIVMALGLVLGAYAGWSVARWLP